MAKQSTNVDHIVIGLDDATPNTMQEANTRRWRMWNAFMNMHVLQTALLGGILLVQILELLK